MKQIKYNKSDTVATMADKIRSHIIEAVGEKKYAQGMIYYHSLFGGKVGAMFDTLEKAELGSSSYLYALCLLASSRSDMAWSEVLSLRKETTE